MQAKHLIVLPLAWLGACSGVPGTEPTVEGIRFRQLISESAIDFIHAGGQWHDCLFLSDAGVVCQVTWELLVDTESGQLQVHETPRLHAYRSTLEEALERPSEAEQSAEARRPAEHIRIPLSLAQEIVGLADLADRERTTGQRLATRCIASGVVGDKTSRRDRDF